MMSIWLADVNGKIVKAIVEKSWPLFLQRVSQISDDVNQTNFYLDFQFVPIRCAIIYC
jgi:hypothetical protein